MKTYDTQEEFLKDCNLINNTFEINNDLELKFNLYYPELSIKCFNLKSWNINVRNIDAIDINIDDIEVYNINAFNINAFDIKANNIKATTINSSSITANDISYVAVCFAYNDITCNSIEGRQNNSKHFCLNGDLTINGVKQNDKN